MQSQQGPAWTSEAGGFQSYPKFGAGGRKAFIILPGLWFVGFPQLKTIPGVGSQLPELSAAEEITASVVKGDLGATTQSIFGNCPCIYGVESCCFGFQSNLT